MTRAALLGAVTGLLLGGAILAVLALQMSVVRIPGESQAVARPEAADPGTTGTRALPVPPPGDRIVSPAPGPGEAAPQQTARLTDAVGETRPPAVPQVVGGGPYALPGLSGLADAASAVESPLAIAGILAAPPKDANAIRGFRALTASMRHATIMPARPQMQALSRRSDPGAVVRGVAPARVVAPAGNVGERVVAAPALARLSGISPTLSSVPHGAPDPTPRATEPENVPTLVALPRAPRNGPGAAAPTVATEYAAPQAQPARRAGELRPPMILWLVTDLPAGTAAPDWTVTLGEAGAQQGVASLPPLDQPEALASFAGALERDPSPGAPMLHQSVEWPALLLAPVLNLPALREMPVLYPGGAAPDTVALLQSRAPRSMPVYGGLDADTPGAAVDVALATVAERARRDGLVVVQVPAEPAVLEAVTAWRNGPGADLETAGLRDLFGG